MLFLKRLSQISVFSILIFIGAPYQKKAFGQTPETLPPPGFSIIKRWDAPLDSAIGEKVASDNELELLFVTSGSKLISLSTKTGEKIWETDLGAEIVSAPAISDDSPKSLYIVSNKIDKTDSDKESPTNEIPTSYKKHKKTSRLISISLKTGITNWQKPLGYLKQAFLTAYGNQIVVVGTDGQIMSISAKDNSVGWTLNTQNQMSSIPYRSEGFLYAATEKNKILKINLNSGAEVEQISVLSPAVILYVPADSEDANIIWGNKKGEVISQDIRRSKEIWKIRTGAEIKYLTGTPDAILVSSLDNFIYAISLKDGKKIWKKRIIDRVSIEPSVLENYVITTGQANSTAIFLDAKTGRQINRLVLDSDRFFRSVTRIGYCGLIFQTSGRLSFFDISGEHCAKK